MGLAMSRWLRRQQGMLSDFPDLEICSQLPAAEAAVASCGHAAGNEGVSSLWHLHSGPSWFCPPVPALLVCLAHGKRMVPVQPRITFQLGGDR